MVSEIIARAPVEGYRKAAYSVSCRKAESIEDELHDLVTYRLAFRGQGGNLNGAFIIMSGVANLKCYVLFTPKGDRDNVLPTRLRYRPWNNIVNELILRGFEFFKQTEPPLDQICSP